MTRDKMETQRLRLLCEGLIKNLPDDEDTLYGLFDAIMELLHNDAQSVLQKVANDIGNPKVQTFGELTNDSEFQLELITDHLGVDIYTKTNRISPYKTYQCPTCGNGYNAMDRHGFTSNHFCDDQLVWTLSWLV